MSVPRRKSPLQQSRPQLVNVCATIAAMEEAKQFEGLLEIPQGPELDKQGT
jgi:hypothetical protein